MADASQYLPDGVLFWMLVEPLKDNSRGEGREGVYHVIHEGILDTSVILLFTLPQKYGWIWVERNACVLGLFVLNTCVCKGYLGPSFI